ncbi:MAG TPA: sigma-70 family RNA polymerase sigma factor [Nitrospirales bacterium]|nr:sigma-70 family RNA polymerase sigma factor [Nitrospirales bacterium]HIC03954.1 sigma-70 family RNA polymerase sigma factor [Nitrospirales bacterium]HIN33310.1 sigma-70 family RNA polymerase sigma factor [Nitrospirales bacterium]HIO69054.1 sigma-70 family RNA polymerase sigma factor [Nitrospirales bacterium]
MEGNDAMLAKLQDNELVTRAQQGRHDAFEELVSRYAGRLYSMGRRMCGNDDDAKDMLQETFMAAFKGIDGFRAEAKFSVWLFQIAKHACMRMRRKSTFAPRETLSLEELVPNEEELKTLSVADWRRTPIDKLLNKELQGALDEAIQVLPPDHRMVLLLRDVEGFSAEETGQIVGASISAVKSRLHRARLFTRKHLHHFYQDQGSSHV